MLASTPSLVVIAKYAWFIRDEQIVEATLWLLLIAVAALHRRSAAPSRGDGPRTSLAEQLPTVPRAASGSLWRRAWNEENAVVLGYDVHGKPWKWADETRCHAGAGAGTDRQRQNDAAPEHHHPGLDAPRRTSRRAQEIPMVIFDGRATWNSSTRSYPYIHRAGRMADLRLLNPSRPDLSVQYNPFASEDDNYMAQVSMVFGSFNLQNEFFAKHQLNYLADIVRILHYTGKRFNFYDVMVMALDQAVIEDQVDASRAVHGAGPGDLHAAPVELRNVGP